MKRHLGWLLIALAVILSSSVAQGQGIPQEVMAQGIVPAEWGALRGVLPGPDRSVDETRLFFEDSKGVIRVVTLSGHDKIGLGLKDDWRTAFKKVVVIQRNP